MSGNISFNGIPAVIRIPGAYAEVSNARAVRGLSAWPARVLVAGQRLSAGTAPASVPVRVTGVEQARALFGRGSMLAGMFEAWFRAQPWVEVWGLPINDNAAHTTASVTLTLSGTAAASGTIAMLVAGRRVEVGVAAGATGTVVATAIMAAVNQQPDLVVTAGAALNQCILTSRHRGEVFNQLAAVRLSPSPTDALPAGIHIAVSPGVLATGTVVAELGAAIDALGDSWFTDLVLGWSDAATLAAIHTRLAAMFGPMQARDCHAWASAVGSFAAMVGLGNGLNSPHLTILAGGGISLPTWEVASVAAAVAVPQLADDPARPAQGLVLPGVPANALLSRFTRVERELLLRDGISTIDVDAWGNVHLERLITTYQTAGSGADDISFLDIETMKTLAFLRYDLRQMISQRYPRHKLADDGTAFARGQAVVTPGLLRAEIIARASQWEAAGLVEGMEQFKRDLVVTRNPTDPNRVDALIPPDVVNQFRVLAAQIQFLL